MKNILDMIFIKDVKINTNSFRNLYYSSDKSSFKETILLESDCWVVAAYTT